MTVFTLTKEVLGGTVYYSTSDIKGNSTTMFDMCGTTFVMVNKSPARPLSHIRKKSEAVKFLESAFKVNVTKAKSVKNEPLRIRLAKKHTTSEIEKMMHVLQDDPDSKIGAKGLDIYNPKVMKKLDEMSWAIYYLTKDHSKTSFQPSSLERKLH